MSSTKDLIEQIFLREDGESLVASLVEAAESLCAPLEGIREALDCLLVETKRLRKAKKGGAAEPSAETANP